VDLDPSTVVAAVALQYSYADAGSWGWGSCSVAALADDAALEAGEDPAQSCLAKHQKQVVDHFEHGRGLV